MNKYAYGALAKYENNLDTWTFYSRGGELEMGRSNNLIDCLNMLGGNGWELITFDEKSKEYIFKKQI